MTELSRQILSTCQVRKTDRQKTKFIALLRSRMPQLSVEEAGKRKSRNLILGDLEQAKVVFTAHYDTCPLSLFPNLSMPYRGWLRPFYAILSLTPILAVTFIVMALLNRPDIPPQLMMFGTLAVYYVLMFGKYFYGLPNPKSVNDNTSGVITLLETWQSMGEDARRDIAVVLFDDEEKGCVGSKAFYQLHKDLMEQKLLLNLDCVGDGDTILLTATQEALIRYEAVLRTVFTEEEGIRIVLDRSEKVKYSSDHKHFPVGVGVSARRRNALLGLYFGRIHTPWDTVLRTENITYLTSRLASLPDCM